MEKHKIASSIALGGILAALAVVIMALGGMIPVATFVCPMLCMLLLKLVFSNCGRRIAWAWYFAVAILGVLLSPDKESSAVFLALGYYPICKPKLDTLPFNWLWKLLFFNGVILVLYWLLMYAMGMEQILSEFTEMGIIMTVVTLLLANVCFILLDHLLGLRLHRRR